MIELPPAADIQRAVNQALAEDIGSGDITARLIPEQTLVSARLLARESGVLCGQAWFNEVFQQLDASVEVHWQHEEGARFDSNTQLATVSGSARTLMTGERTALNFLQTLSGTATITANLVKKVAHTGVRLLDTRKTLPGLRLAQKYAVRIGGGQNHRLGLYDAYLIKENHIAACGGIEAAINTARSHHADLPVEVEVRNLEEMQRGMDAGADIIMLDNFSPEQIRAAVSQNQGRCKLEASGGIDSASLVNIAETGVDYISIGALTKHCQAIDLSFLLP